jgi:D-alanyl-D-alanine carboxypeptidase (penicillin-binding protein 5/6)
MVALISLILIAGGFAVAPFIPTATALEPLEPPDVTAEAVYVVDTTLGTVLYERNADERRAPASLTKIATALVVVELAGDLAEPVTIDPADVLDPEQGQSMVGLVAGDVLTVEQLLYGLMVVSGNDAANTLARHFGQQLLDAEGRTGDPRERFIEEMNAYAGRLGLANTHFVNAEGLYAEDHYTSARDLAALAALLMQNETLAMIVGTEEIILTSLAAVPLTYPLQNTNRLLGENGIDGMKTGTLSESGACLVATRTGPAGTRLITVVLGSDIEFTPEGFQDPETDQRWDDARALFDAASRDYTWLSPESAGAIPGLAEELAVWEVGLADRNPFIIHTSQLTNLRYVLRLGPPAEPDVEVGEVLLYDGASLIDSRPVVQLAPAA